MPIFTKKLHFMKFDIDYMKNVIVGSYYVVINEYYRECYLTLSHQLLSVTTNKID